MKLFLKAMVFISVIALIAGCGGGGSSVPTDGAGKLSVAVNWPDTKFLPAETTKITINVIQGTTNVFTGTITRPASEITTTDIPAGAILVQGFAYDADDKLVATAEATGTIEVGKLANILLTFSTTIIDPAFRISGAVAPDAGDPTKKKISLSSIIDPATGLPITGLDALVGADWVKVFVDGLAADITIVPTSETTSKADIAFAVDSTGSMSGTITGVKNSISAFATGLTTAGLDVRFAGVDFYDKVGYDLGDAAPADLGIFALNFDKTTAEFQTWVTTLSATGGGDGPEVSVDAIYELHSRCNWRAGAQRIIIAITDVVSHQRDDGTDYALWTADEAIAACLGNTVVHTVSPGTASGALTRGIMNDGRRGSFRSSTSSIDIKGIADATGGKWIEFPSDGNVDLTTIGISSIISSGWVITFTDVRTGTTHTVRVILSKDGKLSDVTFDGVVF